MGTVLFPFFFSSQCQYSSLFLDKNIFSLVSILFLFVGFVASVQFSIGGEVEDYLV